MNRSTAFDFLSSINAAAKVVTEATAMFTSEQLAGQYAFDAAKEAGCGVGQGVLEAHLDSLADAGAEFDYPQALAIAQQFAVADASIWMVEQQTGHQWEPVDNGASATESGAETAMQALIDTCGWDASSLRVVEYTGFRAAAYAPA